MQKCPYPGEVVGLWPGGICTHPPLGTMGWISLDGWVAGLGQLTIPRGFQVSFCLQANPKAKGALRDAASCL